MKFLFKKVVASCVNAISFFIPKNKNNIFICDANARKDNTWAIMLELVTQNKGYTITYYTENLSISKPLNGVTFTNKRFYAFFAFFRAKTVFWAYGPLRLFLKPFRGQRIINLWHGSPLKDISFFADTKGKFAYRDSFTHVLSASKFFDPIMQKTFDCKTSQILTLGAPRNDMFFTSKDAKIKLNIEKKTIIWMPTFRKSDNISRCDSEIEFPLINENNISELNEILLEFDYQLIIKPHPAAAGVNFLNQNQSNIIVIYNDDLFRLDLEIYELLACADLLLTDYSSVYFDFLITQKPIGFIIDDIDSYKANRGFVVENPTDLMPGAKISTLEDLKTLLNDLINGNDKYIEDRKQIMNLTNQHSDNKNCKRILDFLEL